MKKRSLSLLLVFLLLLVIVPGTVFALKNDGSAGAENASSAVSAEKPENEKNEIKNGLYKDADGVMRYYKNNTVDTTAKGVAQLADQSSGTWYYVEKGVYKNATGITKRADGSSSTWFYVQNGKYDKNAKGIAQKADGSSKTWYYVKNGKYVKNAKGIAKKADGSSKTWYYVKNGKYVKTAKGIAKKADGSSKTWYYVQNGKYVKTAKGIAKKADGSSGTWYYVKNGKYVKTAKGLAQKADGSSKTWYYVKNGKYVKNYRGAVTFNKSDWNVLDGKATKVKTKEQRTLFRALKLLPKITNSKMTKSQKLKACFDYVKKAYIEMNPRIPHYRGMDWPVVYANDMFVNGKGNCLSYAASFAYLAKAIGYKNVYCCHSGGHGWAEINGLIYDPEWSMHHFKYSYYALSYDKKTDQGYKGAIAAGYPWMHIKI